MRLTRSEIAEYLERRSGRKFSGEDIKQLYAYLEQQHKAGNLDKRRANKTYVFHVRRKSMTIN